MNKQDIISILEGCGFANDSAATQIHYYTKVKRKSLTKDQVDNRNSTGWGRGEYIIAEVEQGDNCTLADLMKGWKKLASKYQNQYLILEVAQDDWRIYDYNCIELGGNNYISNLFSRSRQPLDSLQKIYFGSPGTGKSFKIKGSILKTVSDEFIFRTTFHPDTDYASFVGCYKPTIDPATQNITYSFCPQVFTEAYIAAWKNPERNIFLVIEEINRGNCAQIFGDIFQLLDRKNGVSEYPIKADKDLADYLVKQLGEESKGIANGELCLPCNLNILATMNTSDQSLFPMDSAFKRRWDWEFVPIEPGCKDSQFKIEIADKTYAWAEFITKVNEKILKLSESEDKQLGNFFIKKDITKEEFKSKVMFYLWSEICKDYYNSGSFFKYKDADNEVEFTFNMLYSDKDNTILQGFMESLGVAEM